MRAIREQEGQASVELVALLPLLALAALGLWQGAVAGQALWLVGAAARSAARAQAVGDDPMRAARAALPAGLERGLRVESLAAGGVVVRLRIPSVLGAGALASTTARARLPGQGP